MLVVAHARVSSSKRDGLGQAPGEVVRQAEHLHGLATPRASRAGNRIDQRRQQLDCVRVVIVMVVRHAEHAQHARVGAVQRRQLFDRGPRLTRVDLRPACARAASTAGVAAGPDCAARPPCRAGTSTRAGTPWNGPPEGGHYAGSADLRRARDPCSARLQAGRDRYRWPCPSRRHRAPSIAFPRPSSSVST